MNAQTLTEDEVSTWWTFYSQELSRFRFPVYPGTRYDEIATQRTWNRFRAWKHPKLNEWTTLNNEAGKDRAHEEVSISCIVRPMPIRLKVAA